MTMITKKPDSQIAHLTPEDIEMLGIELDAIRQSVIDSRGESDAKYIRKVIKTQRSLELGSRAVLLFSIFPPAWLVGTAGLSVAKILDNMEIGHNILHGQWDWMRDPKIHSTTWEWDHATPAEQWKVSHNELHHNFTNVVGKDNDLGYGIMRVDEDQPWQPFYVVQPLWNFINALFFEYGIAAYDLELRGAMARGQLKDPAFKKQAKKVVTKVRRQVTKDYVVHPMLSGPVVPAHPGRQLHRQRGAQRLGALGDHVRPLPRGRRDVREEVDRGRDPRRVVPPPDARLGQHLGLQADAHHDRQPLPPDRAPPVPRPALQPVRRDRAEGGGPVREVRPLVLLAPAAPAGLLGLAQGGPALAAQRLHGVHDPQNLPSQLGKLYKMVTGTPRERRLIQASLTREVRRLKAA